MPKTLLCPGLGYRSPKMHMKNPDNLLADEYSTAMTRPAFIKGPHLRLRPVPPRYPARSASALIVDRCRGYA